MKIVRVLGIDPGSRFTGWGIIDGDGRRSQHVASGVLKLGDGDIGVRLRGIFDGITALVTEYQPHEFAIESAFVARNADSALKLGQARGAAICAALGGGLPFAEYAPRAVKLAVVGTGSASKEQVQHMMRVILKLSAPPRADQADALAVALCHAHSRALKAALAR